MKVKIKVASSHALSKPFLLPGKKINLKIPVFCFDSCKSFALGTICNQLFYLIIMKMIHAHHLKMKTLLKTSKKTVTNDPEFTTQK